MLIKNDQTLLKVLILMIAVLLGACSNSQQFTNSQLSQRPLAESFASERAASIAQVIPMQVGRFILENAVANRSTVYLSLRTTNVLDHYAQSLNSELDAIGYGLCQDKRTTLMIQQGVTYHLSIFNAKKVKLSEVLINPQTCATQQFLLLPTVTANKANSR